MQCESSVCRILEIRCAGKESEPECVVNPVENGSCRLDIAVLADIGKDLRCECIGITVADMIGAVVTA